jgi:hypothetical protein
MSDSIGSFVRNYIAENGSERGCPKYVLQAQGFKDADIKNAIAFGILETKRGRDGGLFPAGEKPAAQSSDPTLKGRMVEILRTLASGGTPDMGEVTSILADYDAECQRRSESKRASA